MATKISISRRYLQLPALCNEVPTVAKGPPFHRPRPANALSHSDPNEDRPTRRHSALSKFMYSYVHASDKTLSLRASSNTGELGFLPTSRSAGTNIQRGVGKLMASAKYPIAPDTLISEAKSPSSNCRGREPTTSASISKRSSSMPLVATISGCPEWLISSTWQLSRNSTWAAIACILYPNSAQEILRRRFLMQSEA